MSQRLWSCYGLLASILLLWGGMTFAATNIVETKEYAEYIGESSATEAESLLDLAPVDNEGNDVGIHITGTDVTGKIWSEDFGWIEMINVTVSLQILNNQSVGIFSGKGFSEYIGWVSFGGDDPDVFVYVDEWGVLHGTAFAENFGFFAFGNYTKGIPEGQPGHGFTGPGNQDSWAQTTFLPDSVDSDGDGLPDLYEIYVTLTDPHDQDSDDDVTDDGDEDPDDDGLTNLQERYLGHHPLNANSDSTYTLSVDESTNAYNDGAEDFDDDWLINRLEYEIFTSDPKGRDSDFTATSDYSEANDQIIDGSQDLDGDGVTNAEEVVLTTGDWRSHIGNWDIDEDGDNNAFDSDRDDDGTNDSVDDEDGDTLLNRCELDYSSHEPFNRGSLNVLSNDSDGDGTLDGPDDHDGDGFTNSEECNELSSNPDDETDPGDSIDSDGDGMPNGFEFACGIDPLDPSDAALDQDVDGNGDPDPDGLTNLEEYQHGSDCNDPDTDDDGLRDKQEVECTTNPAMADSDVLASLNINEAGDGIADKDEDSDKDGLPNRSELEGGCVNADTDGDGLKDWDEITVWGTFFNNPDSDGDGLNDGIEAEIACLLPMTKDAHMDHDGDGITSIQEVIQGRDPCKDEALLAASQNSRNVNPGGNTANLRTMMTGMTREEIASAIVQQHSSRETFSENYADSLALADRVNEGRSAQRITYIDEQGHERFAGFIKGKIAANDFRRGSPNLVYRRHREGQEGYLASAGLEPEFRPQFTVFAIEDLEVEDTSYRGVILLHTLGLLRTDQEQKWHPDEMITWEELLDAMLWINQHKKLTYEQYKDFDPLLSVPIRNNRRSQILYTALRYRIIGPDFDIKEPVRRGQVFTMLAEAHNLSLEHKEKDPVFTDITPIDPMYDLLQAAGHERWFDGAPMLSFGPTIRMTRGLFAHWFVGAMGEDNPLGDTPTFELQTDKRLVDLYEDIYRIKEERDLEVRRQIQGTSLHELRQLSDAERVLRARELKKKSRAEKRSIYGPVKKKEDQAKADFKGKEWTDPTNNIKIRSTDVVQ